MIVYFIVFVCLFLLELAYFKVADHFNIIDKPNERSSHTRITLRGGGIIFYFAGLIYFVYSGFQYPFFFIGLTLMTIISFLDDVFTLSNKIRLIIHFTSVLLMAYELNIFEMPWYYLLIAFIIIVGVINAYNFMDGINGITACYSLAIGGLLMIANSNIGFMDQDLLTFTVISVLVFSFFNFRINAKCFAGDVGSVAIAYILLFGIGSLIFTTGNYIFILFLFIYGLDAVWTIVERLLKKENIFKAHRTHLYQYLVNEAKANKLIVSLVYGLLQFVIGFATIYLSKMSNQVQMIFVFSLLIGGSVLYLFLKSFIFKKYVLKTNSTR